MEARYNEVIDKYVDLFWKSGFDMENKVNGDYIIHLEKYGGEGDIRFKIGGNESSVSFTDKEARDRLMNDKEMFKAVVKLVFKVREIKTECKSFEQKKDQAMKINSTLLYKQELENLEQHLDKLETAVNQFEILIGEAQQARKRESVLDKVASLKESQPTEPANFEVAKSMKQDAR